MSKFKVGDFVTVVDDGLVYAYYGEIFEFLGFRNKYVNSYKIFDTNIAQVFAITIHPDKGNYLIAIVYKNGKELLVHEDALALAEFKREEKTIVYNGSKYNAKDIKQILELSKNEGLI